MLDYGSLPFITSQNPYVELFRNPTGSWRSASAGPDVQFAVYGWSLRPIYASGSTTWMPVKANCWPPLIPNPCIRSPSMVTLL